MRRSAGFSEGKFSASSLSRQSLELFNSTHKLKLIQIYQSEVLLGGQE